MANNFTQVTLRLRQMRVFASVVGFTCLALFALASCARSGSGSLLQVEATISPEPVVGQEVTLHIEIHAQGRDLPDTKMKVWLPEGIELVSGSLEWQGSIPADQTVAVDLVIRVTTTGEGILDASAFSAIGDGGVGDTKRLVVTSSTDTATVIDYNDRPVTVPVLQIIESSSTPPTTSP